MSGEGCNDLRAGPLAVALVGPDLRYLSFEGEELVRRIYMAVRDVDWRTIPAIEQERTVDIEERSFSARIHLATEDSGIDLEWVLEIDGTETGTIDFVMKARALADFQFAKIGLCIHHPIEGAVGRRWTGNRDGKRVSGLMPKSISPQIELRPAGIHLPMIPPVESLAIDQHAGIVRFDFGGDLYETEDQRNWSDASFKTYSMPAFTGYLHHAGRGEEFVQRVRIEFEPRASLVGLRRRSGGRPSSPAGRLELGSSAGLRMPPIGLEIGDGVSAIEVERLRELSPAHLRVDVDCAGEDWSSRLDHVLSVCAAIGAGLELGLLANDDPKATLEAVERSLIESRVHVTRILVLAQGEEATPGAWIELVRKSTGLEAPIGGGSATYFAELLRSLPDLRSCSFLAWSLNPQVHAFTDLDLVENLDGQGEQLRSGRLLAGDRDLCITPVTLEPRSAIGGSASSGGPDPRLATRLGAAWTIGSIRQMALGGAGSATYFQVRGDRGVLIDGEAYPVFHALADVCGLRGAEVLPLTSDEEPWLSAIAAVGSSGLVALVANLESSERRIEVDFGFDCGPTRLRILDSRTEHLARTEPGKFRTTADTVEPKSGVIPLLLEPYAVARIEPMHLPPTS